MNKNRGLVIAALIVAIIGLSIGFAAFSNTLNISSTASVNPNASNFKVVFAKNTNVQSLDTTDVTPTKSPNNVTGFTAEDAEINNEALAGPTLTNLKANFTAPGQSVTYTLNVVNAGKYIAYLKQLVFANAGHATNSETYKHCYAATTREVNGETESIPTSEQATGTLVTQACQGISISVSIGTSTNLTYSAQPISLGNQALSANGGNVQAVITISYDSNAAYVDGPMEVEFGSISFTASSNEGSNQQQEQGGQGGNEQGGEQETPASNTVTLTTAQIAQGMYEDGMFAINVTNEWASEQKSALKNNATFNDDTRGYSFNDIICSDNSLVNKSDLLPGEALINSDNHYWIQYIEYEGQSMLQIQIKKNGVLMTNENYTSDDFKDITFTITGSDS